MAYIILSVVAVATFCQTAQSEGLQTFLPIQKTVLRGYNMIVENKEHAGGNSVVKVRHSKRRSHMDLKRSYVNAVLRRMPKGIDD